MTCAMKFDYSEEEVRNVNVGRYWSEVLCYTIMTHLGDLEFKVTDFEILC